MNKKTFQVGGILMILGIILGAFGAHAFKAPLSEIQMVDSYSTAVSYLIYHALAFLALSMTRGNFEKIQKFNLQLLLIGVLLFSFSIFALCLFKIFDYSKFKTLLVIVTPTGGLCMIISWIRILTRLKKVIYSPNNEQNLQKKGKKSP